MHEVCYSVRSDLDKSVYKREQDILKKVEPALIQEYFRGREKEYQQDMDIGGAWVQLRRILNHYQELLENAVFLDLGCGSIFSKDNDNHTLFEPWLCRILHHYGANVTGIDISKPSREEIFRYIQSDLLSATSLDLFPDNSVDIVNAFQLFSSPTLGRLCENNLISLGKIIRPQLERILKPEGLFIHCM
jgi:SAM-dependent methyltransferase